MASLGGLGTLGVPTGLVLASGVTAVLLDGLLSVCAVFTAVLLVVTTACCGVDGFAGLPTCCWSVGMSLFLSLAGVLGIDLGVGDAGLVGGPPLLLVMVASSTLLAAGEDGFVDLVGDIDFAADPLLLILSMAASSVLLPAGVESFFSS